MRQRELSFHERMSVPVAAPDALVHKALANVRIRIDEVPPVDNDRVFLSGEMLHHALGSRVRYWWWPAKITIASALSIASSTKGTIGTPG